MANKKFNAFKEAYAKSTANQQSASTVSLNGKWSPLDVDDYNRLVFSEADGRTVAFSAAQLKRVKGFKLGAEMPTEAIVIKSKKTEERPVMAYKNWPAAKAKLDALEGSDDDKKEESSKIFEAFNAKKGDIVDNDIRIYTHSASVVSE